jgi:hypothetical protein
VDRLEGCWLGVIGVSGSESELASSGVRLGSGNGGSHL